MAYTPSQSYNPRLIHKCCIVGPWPSTSQTGSTLLLHCSSQRKLLMTVVIQNAYWGHPKLEKHTTKNYLLFLQQGTLPGFWVLLVNLTRIRWLIVWLKHQSLGLLSNLAQVPMRKKHTATRKNSRNRNSVKRTIVPQLSMIIKQLQSGSAGSVICTQGIAMKLLTVQHHVKQNDPVVLVCSKMSCSGESH